MKSMKRKFLSCEQGNIAIMSALAAVPIMISIAGVIDFSRYSSVRSEMQRNADHAVLASLRYKGKKWSERQSAARHVFFVNMSNMKPVKKLTGRLYGRRTEKSFTALFQATAKVPTLFGGFSKVFNGEIIINSAASISDKNNYTPVLIDPGLVMTSRRKKSPSQDR